MSTALLWFSTPRIHLPAPAPLGSRSLLSGMSPSISFCILVWPQDMNMALTVYSTSNHQHSIVGAELWQTSQGWQETGRGGNTRELNQTSLFPKFCGFLLFVCLLVLAPSLPPHLLTLSVSQYSVIMTKTPEIVNSVREEIAFNLQFCRL